MNLSGIFRRQRWPGHPAFRLTVDGEVVGYFESDRAARDALPEDYKAGYYVHELVGSERRHRWFVRSFGYRCGTTSTADLARAGVGIAPSCISEDK